MADEGNQCEELLCLAMENSVNARLSQMSRKLA